MQQIFNRFDFVEFVLGTIEPHSPFPPAVAFANGFLFNADAHASSRRASVISTHCGVVGDAQVICLSATSSCTVKSSWTPSRNTNVPPGSGTGSTSFQFVYFPL